MILPPGKYTAEIYSDAADAAENPNNVSIIVQTLTNTDTITLQLASGGGQAMRLIKQ